MAETKRIIRFTYAAIKRYGVRCWTVGRGVAEINTNYLVSISKCEIQDMYSNFFDKPYIVELSNGTRMLVYFHDYGTGPDDHLLSEKGEEANAFVADDVYNHVSFAMLKHEPINPLK